MNSRPLTNSNDDINDMAINTAQSSVAPQKGPLPLPDVYHWSDIYHTRLRFIQYLADQFWRRWITEYLPELQRSHKWTDKQVNVKEENVYEISDVNTSRSLWPLGLVIQAKLGRHNMA